MKRMGILLIVLMVVCFGESYSQDSTTVKPKVTELEIYKNRNKLIEQAFLNVYLVKENKPIEIAFMDLYLIGLQEKYKSDEREKLIGFVKKLVDELLKAKDFKEIQSIFKKYKMYEE